MSSPHSDLTDPALVESAERLRFSDAVIRLRPLPNGGWAIYGHEREPTILASLNPLIVAEISLEAESYGRRQKARYISTAEARFYGEPDDRSFAKDLKRNSRPARPTLPQPTIDDLAIDL